MRHLMAKIEIIKIPVGEAPRWVRQAWVGLILPLSENVPKKGFFVGVQTVDIINTPENEVYDVEEKIALQILETKNPQAAKWWREQCISSKLPWKGIIHLSFLKNECKLIN